MKLSSSVQMKQMDKEAIKTGIPDIVLMENASVKSFFQIKSRYENIEGALSVAFVGVGNNGGDAIAISRHLYNNGANVFIYMLTDEEKLNASPKTNFEIVKNMGIQYKIVKNESDFDEEIIKESDIIIDGIFGIGLSRNVEGIFKKAIELINDSDAFIVSVDIPSGIKADSGEVMGEAVRADLTTTFALAKPGHFLYPGREHSGEVEVVDITTPKYILDEFNADFYAIEKEDISINFREPTSHKGTYGHLNIIGGSKGKSGAVILASKAALRCGAGLVSTTIPNSINTAFEANIVEAMSCPVGNSDEKTFSDKDISEILEFAKDKDAVAFGMGLGVNDSTKKLTKHILRIDKPILIDADGINCLSENVELLKARKAPTILTPHPKEFARLTNLTVKEVGKNRLSIIKEFSSEHNVILVLKMADTLVSTPQGKIYINTTGNPGLATGGSGDILSGMIASFLAQGYEALQSCINGVFLHGLAADLAYDDGFSYESLTPQDVIEYINEAIVEITG